MASESAAQTLSQQPSSALIDLYFDCEEPEERDAVCDALKARADASAVAFFAAMLEQDEDPYLQATAAAALLTHEAHEAAARAHLMGILKHGTDEILFEEALWSLLQRPSEGLYADLEAIGADTARDLMERRLARVAMEQLDAARTVAACHTLLRDANALVREPLDLVAVALAALVRSGGAQDAAAINAASEGLLILKSPSLDADDLAALQDLFEEAQAVVHAEAALEPAAQTSAG